MINHCIFLKGSDDDVSTDCIEMICADDKLVKNTGTCHGFGSWSEWLACPDGRHICGMTTNIEPNVLLGDDTAMNDITLRCC